MGTAPKQQKLKPDAVPVPASLVASRLLVEQAVREHTIDGYERQILMDAWDHDLNWKNERMLWFRHSDKVLEILTKYGLMSESK
jgi:hypothetical protein